MDQRALPGATAGHRRPGRRVPDARCAGALPLIAAPTLVLVGAEDILFPVSCAEELVEGIPGARLHVLERGGHIPHLEYPEAVEAALLKFLAA